MAPACPHCASLDFSQAEYAGFKCSRCDEWFEVPDDVDPDDFEEDG